DEHEDVARRWRERLRYLLVDEYQDTNACQYELLKRLVGPRAAFTAVGDDDQSIYGWRGATLENLNRLSAEFPHLKVIKLEQNYRSSRSEERRVGKECRSRRAAGQCKTKGSVRRAVGAVS